MRVAAVLQGGLTGMANTLHAEWSLADLFVRLMQLRARWRQQLSETQWVAQGASSTFSHTNLPSVKS
jgi:hypothetical protein